MTEWIPLLQTLVWPIFITIFILFARPQIIQILKSIATRIERGDPFQAGPSGLSLGSSEPKLTRLDEVNEKPSLGVEVNAETSISTEQRPEIRQTSKRPTQYENVLYLIHSVSAPQVDTDGIERRAVQVIVDADSESILDNIEKVVYHLHPTFPNPDREVTDRKRRFELKTRAWGEFNLSADVYLKGYEEPLKLNRYLSFQNF
jgi:hypothetical protein